MIGLDREQCHFSFTPLNFDDSGLAPDFLERARVLRFDSLNLIGNDS